MKPRSAATRLPPLAFGEHSATVSTDIRTFVEKMSAAITGLNSYDPLDGVRNFASKSCAIEIGGLKVVAGACTPVSADIGTNDDIHLMVPLAGQNTTVLGRQQFEWHVGQHALVLPKSRRGGFSSTRSTLNFRLDPDRLLCTARSMVGVPDDSPLSLGVDEPRSLPLDQFGKRLDEPVRQACRLIDMFGLDGDLLHRMGVDDLLYRNSVLLLRPDLLLSQSALAAGELRKTHAERVLDKLCEYLRAHLGSRITLTDMERVSGLSARSLQYAFRKRFGCTPVEWLRAERLDEARRLLRIADLQLTITQLALHFGFGKASEFSRHYRSRFGESPSRSRPGRGGSADR